MDFDPNEDQAAILEAVEALLEQHAGAARAIELQPKGDYDDALHAALSEAGFTDIVGTEGMGGLEGALVVEAVARSGGVVALGAEVLVAPALGIAAPPGPIALRSAGHEGPVRYGANARTLIEIGDETVRVLPIEAGEAAPVKSNFGYPMGRIRIADDARGQSLGADAAERAAAWWRLALAAEAVGCMDAALAYTVEYLKQRRQFGRAIASFQAVQHRLALCAIDVEASRWLTREAAYRGADAEAAATAAAYSLATAGKVFAETHQLSGAIGFTREHDLHVWSMRLQALRLELGGVGAHRRALVSARWDAGGRRRRPDPAAGGGRS